MDRRMEDLLGIGVLAGVGMGAFALWKLYRFAKFRPLSAGTDSPITVLGGSLTLRSQAPWMPSQGSKIYTTSVQTTPTIAVILDDDESEIGSCSLSGDWSVTIAPHGAKISPVSSGTLNIQADPRSGDWDHNTPGHNHRGYGITHSDCRHPNSVTVASNGGGANSVTLNIPGGEFQIRIS
jgi:hypothetical protein